MLCVICPQYLPLFVVRFLDPIFFGDYPLSMRESVGSRLPNFTDDQIAKVKGSLDFIGINVLTGFYVYDADYYAIDDRLSYYLDWRVNVTGIDRFKPHHHNNNIKFKGLGSVYDLFNVFGLGLI